MTMTESMESIEDIRSDDTKDVFHVEWTPIISRPEAALCSVL